MSLYFITGNKNKFEEAKAIIGDELVQLDIDLPEVQSLDPKIIISSKINEALKSHKGEFIVEDTSLCLDSLNGFPGPLIKWFLVSVGLEGIYRIADSMGNNEARAITMIGYYDGKQIYFVEGVTEGEIVYPDAQSKFGWDPIFKPIGHDKTYARMSVEEKNKISHRGKAFNNLLNLLKDRE